MSFKKRRWSVMASVGKAKIRLISDEKMIVSDYL